MGYLRKHIVTLRISEITREFSAHEPPVEWRASVLNSTARKSYIFRISTCIYMKKERRDGVMRILLTKGIANHCRSK